jgi:L-ascorbate metabolism protein UlaG (beta-lactamase superfamily)
MKFWLLTLMLGLPGLSIAQSDTFDTEAGDLTIHPVLHASMVWEWNGKALYFDPYGGASRYEAYPAPDVVFVTHLHGDHLNPETLKGLDLSGAELVAPQSVVDEMAAEIKDQFAQITVLANGETHQWEGAGIEAVPMYNLPNDESARHPKGWGNGYVLTMGGKRLYVCGDTEDIPEMRTLEGIDVAFLCMNLPYTMDINQAAEAVAAFQPKVVYPFHFRGQDGFSDVAQFQELVNQAAPQVEVRLREWYAE